ncbi:MAG: ABC transporter permease [Actinomycetota bacterium]|nr:ABC transporter permease [Actinomycetota bacterium]
MADAQPKGVIHDLGYRHYDGERLGRWHIVRSLYVDSARGTYGLGRSARSKVMPLLLLAAICLPALIVAVVASVTHLDSLPGGYTSYVLKTQAIVMVFVAGQAPASVSRDLRFRVMSLYLSRPLQRIDYVAAKYAALATATFVLMAVPLTILFVGALLAKLPLSEQVPDYLRALGGAGLTALVVAGLGLVIAAITPRRGLGVAAIITVLALLAGVQGVVGGISQEQRRHTLEGYSQLLSPFTLVQGVQHSTLGAESALPGAPPGALGAWVFAAVLLLVVGGCFGGLLLRYRRVRI